MFPVEESLFFRIFNEEGFLASPGLAEEASISTAYLGALI
jgi:hypothetical protein